jgi:hypothetical protein
MEGAYIFQRSNSICPGRCSTAKSTRWSLIPYDLEFLCLRLLSLVFVSREDSQCSVVLVCSFQRIIQVCRNLLYFRAMYRTASREKTYPKPLQIVVPPTIHLQGHVTLAKENGRNDEQGRLTEIFAEEDPHPRSAKD